MDVGGASYIIEDDLRSLPRTFVDLDTLGSAKGVWWEGGRNNDVRNGYRRCLLWSGDVTPDGASTPGNRLVRKLTSPEGPTSQQNKSIQRIHTPRMNVKNGSGHPNVEHSLMFALHGMQPPPKLTNTS
jgi:hypothetical protein